MDGANHVYTLNGTQIVSESLGNYLLNYLYDESGAPIGLLYRTKSYAANVFDTFYFEKNLQGDIIAVYNASGEKIGSYTYDAWGNCTATVVSGVTSVQSAIVRNYNPFRYRGYFYDIETSLYYLQSRYYNPAMGRFLNSDIGISGIGGKVIGNNLYIYCFNNPVSMTDSTGNWPEWVETAAKVVSAVVLVAAVATTVVAVSAFTAGTGSPAAVFGATVFLGAALSGINGGVANEAEGDSYLNGYIGGATGGTIQGLAGKLPGGTIWGGALGSATGTAITMVLDNLDPYSSNSSVLNILSASASSGVKAACTSLLTATISAGVGGINYKTGELIGGVADGCGGLFPSLTLGFGEGIKAFFGAVDDAIVYIWGAQE